MQIFILSCTVSSPLNSLGLETVNESSLKVGSGETKQNYVIQSCDVIGGGLNPPELFPCPYSHNLLYSVPKHTDTINNLA